MPIFDTLESVASNDYLNDLTDLALKFGVYHTYVDYKNDVYPEYSGIYSVCGLDKDKVNNPNLNIYKLLKRTQLDTDNIFTDVSAVRLTNSGAYASRATLLNYFRILELYKNIYEKFGFQLPNKINHVHADYIEMAYLNMINPKLKIEDRNAYSFAIKNSIQNEIDTIQKNTSTSKKNNAFSKNNCVGLEELVEYSDSIIVGNIAKNIVKDFKREMKKYPEILYWISKKSIKEGYKAPKGQGFDVMGGETNVHIIACDEKNIDKINYIIGAITNPKAFETTVDELKQQGKVSYIAMPWNELKTFTANCQINDIKFCVNDKKIDFLDSSDLCIAFLRNDSLKVKEIIKNMAKENDKSHIYVGLQKSELDTFRDECGGHAYIRTNEKNLKKLISGKISMDDIYLKASPEDLDNIDDIKEIHNLTKSAQQLSHLDR